MPVFTPHGPVHEETEFWYDTKEKALLYEVNTVDSYLKVEADHQRTRDRGHLWDQYRTYHRHYQPHGIYLAEKVIGESRRKTSAENHRARVKHDCDSKSGNEMVRTPIIATEIEFWGSA